MNQPLPSVHAPLENKPCLHDEELSMPQSSEPLSSPSVGELEEAVSRMSKELIQHVQERPLTSLLVAAGFGFAFAALFRK